MVDKQQAGLFTPEEFDRAVRLTRLSDTSRDAARLVLVDGKRQRDVVALMGVTPPRLSAIVTRVMKEGEHLRSQAHSQVEVLEADFALATHMSRARFGGNVQILRPAEKGRYMGEVVGCTSFYAVQDIGRGQVVVHDLSKLDVVPDRGARVAVEYEAGKGRVAKVPARSRSDRSL